MKVNVSLAIRLGCLLSTCALFAAYWLLPDRTFNILNATSDATLYADGDNGTNGSKAIWINQSTLHFQCIIKNIGQDRYCGFTVKQRNLQGEHINLDLSKYTHLNINIRYNGPLPRNIFFYRNTDDTSQNISGSDYDYNQDQLIYTFLDHGDTNKPIKIGLDTFDLADWWLEKYYKERSQIRREKNRITEVGITTQLGPSPGVYDYKIDQIEASGRWLSAQSLYMYTLVIWSLSALLEASIRVSRIIHDRIQLKAEFDKLEETSDRDNLTQVLNRSGFLKAIQSLPSAPDGKHYYLMIFDIDNFKKINDTYGHPAGDSVLCTFADVITANIREDDYFARWGGEEFIVLSCHKNTEHAFSLAEKLRISIMTSLFKAGDTPIKVTTSIGAALLNNSDEFERCLQLADKRLYNAKNTGKNKVCTSP